MLPPCEFTHHEEKSAYHRRKILLAAGRNNFLPRREKSAYRARKKLLTVWWQKHLTTRSYIDPTLTIQDVREILSKSCDDLYTPGKDIYTGYGKVNAYRAVALTAKRAGYTGFPDRLPEDSLNNVKVKVRVK